MRDDLHEQAGVVEVGFDRLVHARVLHLHRDREAVLRDRAVHLSDRRRGARAPDPTWRRSVPARAPSSSLTTCAASSGVIDGASACSSRELLPHRFRQPLIEVARHLPELHQRALHVAERVGDLFRGPQLVLGVELVPALGRREHSPCRGAARTCLRPSRRVLPPRRCAPLVVRDRTGDVAAVLVRTLDCEVCRGGRAESADGGSDPSSTTRHGSGP